MVQRSRATTVRLTKLVVLPVARPDKSLLAYAAAREFKLLRRFLSLTDCSPQFAGCTLNKEENMARADRVARRAKRSTRRASRRTARRTRRTTRRVARRVRRTGRRAIRQTLRAVRRTARRTKRVGRRVARARRFRGRAASEQENIGEEGTAS
jgi:hypothetical protein